MIAPTKDSTLTTGERKQLARYEEAIDAGMKSFIEVGRALKAIRDGGLFTDWSDTFEGYCKLRWSFSASRARQIIGGYQAVVNVESVTTVTPENERQARILASLETPQQQATVWCNAVETAPKRDDGTPIITATHVERTKDKFYPKEPRDVPPPEEEVNQAHQPLEAGPALSEAGEAEPNVIGTLSDQALDYINLLIADLAGWQQDAVIERIQTQLAEARGVV